ncbi:hypothetical protein VTJ49DRAFT_7303 [Mycothermus thermophilus]|uniref:Uncharacterized protein n=1 Tax=Humicola insolens TaxID=85995 RepID=A0ABR3VHF2_HUMIN
MSTPAPPAPGGNAPRYRAVMVDVFNCIVQDLRTPQYRAHVPQPQPQNWTLGWQGHTAYIQDRRNRAYLFRVAHNLPQTLALLTNSGNNTKFAFRTPHDAEIAWGKSILQFLHQNNLSPINATTVGVYAGSAMEAWTDCKDDHKPWVFNRQTIPVPADHELIVISTDASSIDAELLFGATFHYVNPNPPQNQAAPQLLTAADANSAIIKWSALQRHRQHPQGTTNPQDTTVVAYLGTIGSSMYKLVHDFRSFGGAVPSNWGKGVLLHSSPKAAHQQALQLSTGWAAKLGRNRENRRPRDLQDITPRVCRVRVRRDVFNSVLKCNNPRIPQNPSRYHFAVDGSQLSTPGGYNSLVSLDRNLASAFGEGPKILFTQVTGEDWEMLVPLWLFKELCVVDLPVYADERGQCIQNWPTINPGMLSQVALIRMLGLPSQVRLLSTRRIIRKVGLSSKFRRIDRAGLLGRLRLNSVDRTTLGDTSRRPVVRYLRASTHVFRAL